MKARWIGYAGVLMLARVACGLTVAEVVEQITPQQFEQTHGNLFVSSGHNRGFTGDADAGLLRVPAFQHDDARDYIRDRFASFGLETSLDSFGFQKTYGAVDYTYTNCNNVVAIQRGVATDAQWHILGSHYDSVDPGQFKPLSPGADDNASGVAGVLEIARVLSQYRFRDHIVYVAFDAEEKGLVGAKRFVEHRTTSDPVQTNLIQRTAVQGMISLDMIAFNPPGKNQDKARVYGGSTDPAAPLKVDLSTALAEYTAITPVESGVISGSDHGPFHNRGMPSCLLIEYEVWNNPHYHTTADSIDTPGYIDYVYAAEMTRGATAWCCLQAGIILPPTLDEPVRLPGGGTRLSWSAQSGSVYRVECSADLTDAGDWQTVATLTNVQGWGILCITDAVSTVNERFYRVEHLYEP